MLPGDLSSTPRIHVMAGKNQLHKVMWDHTHIIQVQDHPGLHSETLSQTITTNKKGKSQGEGIHLTCYVDRLVRGKDLASCPELEVL